jgi:capsular polysaccharide transport system permease protein
MASFFRGLAIQADVVFALIMRETRTRFGAYSMGYLWALLEPVLMILTFFIFFRIMGRKAPAGMDVWTFLASGIIPYNLFTNSLGRVAESVNGNKALLFYPHVFPLDLAIARAILEIATSAAVFIVLIGVHALYMQRLEIHEPLAVLGALVLANLLGAAVGLIFCGLSTMSNLVDRARGPLLRPLFWISGIFFTASSVPEHARGIMLWNPVLHCTELLRGGLFEEYDRGYADPAYVVIWILGTAVIGLALERIVRQQIELS